MRNLKYTTQLNKQLMWNESLNSDGQQFHQYQQNEQALLPSNYWIKKDYHVCYFLFWWLSLFLFTFQLLVLHNCMYKTFHLQIKEKDCDHVNRLNTAKCVCLSQTCHWIYNVIRRCLFLFNNWREEVLVRFVDIDGIVDHHCLNFHRKVKRNKLSHQNKK
jgi:hypothetical protein